MAESDNDLLSLVANGDRAAFDRLVYRHRGPASAFAYRMLGNRSDADEILQECFARVWSNAPRWNPDGSAKSWIYRIVHNLCIDRLRARRPTVDIEGREFEDTKPNPEQQLARKRAETGIHDAVARLPERQRIAVSLFHLKDMTADEVANTMEISVDALESLLRRARAKLKEIVREQQPDAYARTAVGEH
ncbi:sigma-70 family RNA polymerase sigma factor [Nisaea acidiphila]|uniref:Sigma-70 family RNA polymerase sigma factor n=1 Tax=Nisaea acidiphila TaxID=1862145 RepID=A0A9J7AT30_9PROT|nr:sigma-70 family RNA polymerase sigma factor [Nisaea acidiphila]UUX50018.1 sigma-70 family RNA polymerase sigma factor [Nisaea acidiphila]